MSDNNTSNRTDTVCSIGGKLYYYDACARYMRGMNGGFVYMGEGTIHSVKNSPYNSNRTFHFWRYNDRTLLEVR